MWRSQRKTDCFKMSKALPPSWSGSRVQWHWPVPQTAYEVVHFAAGEHVLPLRLDPFWEPVAAPTGKSNKACSLYIQRHMYSKCRNCHKEVRSGCLHWKQAVIRFRIQWEGSWNVNPICCRMHTANSFQAMEDQKQLSFTTWVFGGSCYLNCRTLFRSHFSDLIW